MRIDAPVREARELLLFAIGCSVIAVAASAAIAAWPMPVYPEADFTADVWYVIGFKLVFMLGGALVWARWRGYRLAELVGTWQPTGRSWIPIAIAIAAGLLINVQHIGPIGDRVGDGVPIS